MAIKSESQKIISKTFLNRLFESNRSKESIRGNDSDFLKQDV